MNLTRASNIFRFYIISINGIFKDPRILNNVRVLRTKNLENPIRQNFSPVSPTKKEVQNQAVESISDTLVHNHLKKLGCMKAKELLKIRNLPEFPESQGIQRLEYLLNDYKSYLIMQKGLFN